MGQITLQSDLPKAMPNYVGKHPKDMNKYEYNQMMKDAVTGKLNNYPEQKKTFLQWLEEQLNNVGNGIQVEPESESEQPPVAEFKPRLDIIQSLTMPLEKRCRMCGTPITTGKYCDRCAKKLVKKNW